MNQKHWTRRFEKRMFSLTPPGEGRARNGVFAKFSATLSAAVLYAAIDSAQAATPLAQSVAALEANPASEYLKLRDPFRIPEVALLSSRPRSELEQFPVSDMRLSAVVTGPLRMKAMIALPNGKNVFVQERDKIGIRNGVVHRITPDGILVQEKIMNVLGQEEGVISEIRISSNTTPTGVGRQP